MGLLFNQLLNLFTDNKRMLQISDILGVEATGLIFAHRGAELTEDVVRYSWWTVDNRNGSFSS